MVQIARDRIDVNVTRAQTVIRQNALRQQPGMQPPWVGCCRVIVGGRDLRIPSRFFGFVGQVLANAGELREAENSEPESARKCRLVTMKRSPLFVFDECGTIQETSATPCHRTF